jgi:hypothetical protein
MTKAQRRLRESESPRGKGRNPFALIREGEPLPDIAQQTLRKPPKARARSRRAQTRPETERCVLCDGTITRFDEQIYSVHGRCAPCHEALEEK